MLELINNSGASPEPEIETTNDESSKEEYSDSVELGSIIAALDGVENAPKDYELEEWKELYGMFYISTIHADDNLYLWRTLKRQEYKQLINGGIAKNQLMYEEAVLKRCCLWPKFTQEKIAGSDAGVIETLAKQILFKSGFVPDSMALNMIKTV